MMLCAAMSVSMLAGCGAKETEAPAETSTEAAADNEAEAVVEEAAEQADLSDANVAVFYYTFADTYIASVRTALGAKLDELGVTYQDYDSNSNQTTQNEQIDTAIQTGATLLIVNIVTSGSVII